MASHGFDVLKRSRHFGESGTCTELGVMDARLAHYSPSPCRKTEILTNGWFIIKYDKISPCHHNNMHMFNSIQQISPFDQMSQSMNYPFALEISE